MEEKKKIRVGTDEPILRKLKSELPKQLAPFNKLRGVLKSAMQTDKINSDYKIAYREFCDQLLDGFPADCSLNFCSQAKGRHDEFKRSVDLYEQCKELDQEYIRYLRLEDGNYIFDTDIDKYLESLSELTIEGNTAIKLYSKVCELLNVFIFLDTLADNRVLKQPADLQKASGLVYHAPDMTLKPNHISIQAVADQLDNGRLNDEEQKAYKELLNEA